MKEEKAAAVVKDGDEPALDEEVTEVSNAPVNGHLEDIDGDGERPMKKFKAEDGTGMALDPDGTEDEMDGDRDAVPNVDDQQEDVDDEDEGDDEEEEDDDDEQEDANAVRQGGAEPDDLTRENDMRDEALDDPGSDSE